MADDAEQRDASPLSSLTPLGLYRLLRRLVIAVLGLSVLALGLALLVLPGPAFVVIPTGLAILALEFGWARRWLRTVRERFDEAVGDDMSRWWEERGSGPDPADRPEGGDSDPSPTPGAEGDGAGRPDPLERRH